LRKRKAFAQGSKATKQSIDIRSVLDCLAEPVIGSGAHSRDPLARNDVPSCLQWRVANIVLDAAGD
jgi:hypothetical protein